MYNKTVGSHDKNIIKKLKDQIQLKTTRVQEPNLTATNLSKGSVISEF